MRRSSRSRRCAVVLAVALFLPACAPGAGQDREEVRGTIDGSDGGRCHLTVTTLSGEPVGETAQIVEEGEEFSWPLQPGVYLLIATCDGREGALEVRVPDPGNSDLVIEVPPAG